MSLCPEVATRAAMTDEEFWAHVFPQEEREFEPDLDDLPELTIGSCLRCGRQITAEDYEGAMALLDQGVDFCAECADETKEEEVCELPDGPLL